MRRRRDDLKRKRSGSEEVRIDRERESRRQESLKIGRGTRGEGLGDEEKKEEV